MRMRSCNWANNLTAFKGGKSATETGLKAARGSVEQTAADLWNFDQMAPLTVQGACNHCAFWREN